MSSQSGVGVGVSSGGNKQRPVDLSSTAWTMGRFSSTYTLNATGPAGAHPDYILELVSDVRNFADVLVSLKEAFQAKEPVESLAGMAEDRLGELLRVLKSVIGKHQTLNSVEILSAAGTVIAKVKGVNFKDVNTENRSAIFREIHASIDTLAFTFGNVVSDFLMGDVDSGSSVGPPQARRSRSFENLSGDSGGCSEETDGLADPSMPVSLELSAVEKVDQALLRNDSGVESALLYAKAWSKYTKDVLAWVEKRLSLDMECAKSFAKLAESAKSVASQQDYMPFRDIYVSAFKNEIEYNQLLLQTTVALQTNKFIQPLVARKNELDKRRKELKEQWQREQKKMAEADSAVRKARLLQTQRREEYEKARNSTNRSGEEQQSAGGKGLEKKRRLEEEALQKAEEAQDHYKTCMADAEAKRLDLDNAKSEILTQIRELVFQCDLTLKAVTVNWFQLLQSQAISLPVKLQALCDQAKQYEPGQCYSEFVHSLPKERVWLEVLSQDSTGPSRTGISFHKRSLSSTHSSRNSGPLGDVFTTDDLNSPNRHRVSKMAEKRSNSTADIQSVKSQCPPQPWSCSGSVGGGGVGSDSESAGGSSETRSVDSPTASPGDFKRRLPRTPSTGTMSSADDLDEREPPSPSDNGLSEMITEATSSPGPFRNAQMSKAAHTHKLRKLRAPSKCRECDSLVVFHGAECEECSLACHKKCLETLAIQCGHKKLQGRLHLFGIDFAQAAKNSPDGIPFIIKKCTSEIESRALNIKGIYRVNGAKSRVEKLCQAFENGKDLVELSDLYPHDISNVLKLYLRQLPEPLILYRYYNEFIGLAKEAKNVQGEEAESASTQSVGEEPGLSVDLNRIIFKIRDLLRQLPQAHYRTLHFLIAHLHRVTERAEENKMTASNLGIIFGPTLIKPRQMEAEVSLSSLVDYPYQALMVELFITHQNMIFDVPLSSVSLLSVLTQDSPSPHSRDKDRLSRHSRSLLDIKEQSSKAYKRHSSVIPSSHLLDEVKEVKAGDAKEDAIHAADSTDGLNGVGSAAEVQRSTLVFGRPSVTSMASGSVQLRPQRARLVSRPISMPVDRLLNEQNKQNCTERESTPAAIQEVTEPEKTDGRYRSPFIHTHTLRRTWDKQYRHYDVTPRTAMIMANLPPSGVTDKTKSVAGAEPASGSGSINTISQSNPYSSAVTIRPFRASWKDSSSSQSGEGPIAFRQPRTLQPPPGTFYKPPTVSRTRSADNEKSSMSYTTASVTATSSPASVTIATVTAASSVTTATVVTMVSVTMGAPVATLTVSTTTATAVVTPIVTTMALSKPSEASEDGRSESGRSESGRSESGSAGSDVVGFSAFSPPLSPSSTPEDLSPTDAKPAYQRLRGSRRLIPNELEHREAHFV